MKKLCIFSIFYCQNILIANATTITLLDAVKSNRVLISATGNSIDNNPTHSSHTGKCLKLTLKNTSSTPLEYNIEPAYHFTCVEDSKQDLISTDNLIVKLQAGQQKEILVNALCCEKNDGAPTDKSNYTLTYKHDGSINKLSTLLNKYKSFDNTAQQSIWCFTDNNPLDNIYDTDKDTLLENMLVSFIASEKKIPIPKRFYQPKRILKYPLEIEGSHSELIETITTIGFYITDSTNHVYTTIIEDDTESRRGTATYSYIYRSVYPAGKYFLKMKKNNNWVIVKEINIGQSGQ